VPGVSSPSDKDASNGAKRVLGSLLVDPGRAPVPEDEWVQLVREIGDGNQDALRELYERTSRIVFTVIYRVVQDSPTAEEVTLDVYHAVWQRSVTFDATRGSVVGWIMNQARSKAIDRLRHEHRLKRVDDGKITVADIIEVEPAGAHRELLNKALQTLTIDERLAIETAYFEELTYAQVAERLGAPLGTVKTRIRSGLAKLRTLLQKDNL
jgi:RNA polymerase sigma-70 factor (ECF subfamily)